jgi:uncharacterized protein with HEPN domain
VKFNERYHRFYVAHMLESIEAIERYCSAGDVQSDERTLEAVLRRLQILTGSSKRVSEELKAAILMFPGVNSPDSGMS